MRVSEDWGTTQGRGRALEKVPCLVWLKPSSQIEVTVGCVPRLAKFSDWKQEAARMSEALRVWRRFAEAVKNADG